MAKLTPEELIEAFKELSLIELSDFVKKFEETFEVEAAAPVAAVAAAPAAGGAGGGEAAEEQTEFDVVLEDAGAKKVPVIKRSGLTCGPQGGQDLVDPAQGRPGGRLREVAEKAKVPEGAGATVTLRCAPRERAAPPAHPVPHGAPVTTCGAGSGIQGGAVRGILTRTPVRTVPEPVGGDGASRGSCGRRVRDGLDHRFAEAARPRGLCAGPHEAAVDGPPVARHEDLAPSSNRSSVCPRDGEASRPTCGGAPSSRSPTRGSPRAQHEVGVRVAGGHERPTTRRPSSRRRRQPGSTGTPGTRAGQVEAC